MLGFAFDVIAEYIAVILSLVYVVLAAKQIKWCWFAGGVGSAIYVYLNIENSLFYDAVLQFYYVVVAVYALLLWNKKDTSEQVTISKINLRLLLSLVIVGTVLTTLLGYFSMLFLKQNTAFFDAGVAAFSFIATWMTARKYLESWLLWIVIDIAAAVMYSLKSMQPTVGLYIAFTVVAVYGYWQWNRAIKNRLL
jgi:nicotinamide mononucleotide transporter